MSSLRKAENTMDYTELLSRYGIACFYVTGQDAYGIYRLNYPE